MHQRDRSPWFDDNSHEAQAYNQVTQAEGHHKAHLSHELIAAAASYEAMKMYHQHCEKNGEPVSHAQAKEILAGLSGAFIDRMVETKGLDFIDRQKAKQHAHERLHYASEPEFDNRREQYYGPSRGQYDDQYDDRRGPYDGRREMMPVQDYYRDEQGHGQQGHHGHHGHHHGHNRD